MIEYEKKLKYARFQKQNDNIYTWSDEYDINEPCEDYTEVNDEYDSFLPPLSYCLLKTETKETLKEMSEQTYQTNITPDIPNGAIILYKDGAPVEMYWVEYQLTIDTEEKP